MLKIQIAFENSSIKKSNYSLMNIDEIYNYMDIDANLSIYFDGNLFFSEDIAIIEFYWYLFTWYKKYQEGNTIPFDYSTIENNCPILSFFYQENCRWKIDSIWKKTNDSIIISEIDLINEIDNLICRLFAYLEKPIEKKQSEDGNNQSTVL